MANATPEKCRTSSARPRRHRLRLSALLLAVLGLAGPLHAALPLPDLSHTLTTLKPAKPARDFTLPDLDGKPHRLSDYRGKVVVLNFWATWCPPCRREMPSMERLHQKFKDQALVVLAVNEQETADQVFVFTGQLDPAPTFPILFDGDSAVAKAWGVLGLPASFIVDKKGRVVYRAMGGRDFEHPEMERALRPLLAQ